MVDRCVIEGCASPIISSKASSRRITAPSAELVAIRLEIAKTTSLNTNRVIIITDSLSVAKHVRAFFNLNTYNKLEF